ncbi:hypothetical protein MKW92_029530, partial [Papaver armeniacum]
LNVRRITAEEGEYLSNLYETEFLATPLSFSQQPINWDPRKHLALVCEVDKFIEVYYYTVTKKGASVKKSVTSFVQALNRYKVKGGWKQKVDGFILKKKVEGVADNMVGLIHITRNTKTHLADYTTEER